MQLPQNVAEQLVRLALGKGCGFNGSNRLAPLRSKHGMSEDDQWYGEFYPDQKGVPFGIALSAFVLKDLAMKLVQSQAADAASSVHMLAEMALAVNDARGIAQGQGGKFDNVYDVSEKIARKGIIWQYRKDATKHSMAVNFAGSAKPNKTYFAVRFAYEDSHFPVIKIQLKHTKIAGEAYPDNIHSNALKPESGQEFYYALGSGDLI